MVSAFTIWISKNRSRIQKKSNVYKGRITRVEPSLEAAFVDFGAERHGFLPLKEISRQYFSKTPGDNGKLQIRDLISTGTEIIVQVEKEERGNKGAALTTFISLAGRYLVLMPNNPRGGGISRRIEGEERSELREALSQLQAPKGMSLIVRTAGIGRSADELQADLNRLTDIWNAVNTAAQSERAPKLLLQEDSVIIRTIRDYLRDDIGEVIIDQQDAFQLASDFVTRIMPTYARRVQRYDSDIPLFNRYQVESQIETAFQREVKLPSGGSVVIDPTEALVSIDINSARATKGGDIEETALQTNLEAADEIARQLRLRDIGGLIVVDFIDMSASRNQREVEARLNAALKPDRARVQAARISKFGLLELSRQRLRPSLGETSAKVCPRCDGQGTIRDTKSLALSILRILNEEAGKERSAEIRAIVPVSVATYLLNEKRSAIHAIEADNNTRVLVVANPELETPRYAIQRLRDDNSLAALRQLSYKIDLRTDEEPATQATPTAVEAIQKQAVVNPENIPQSHTPPKPAKPKKAAKRKKQPSLLRAALNAVLALFGVKPASKKKGKGKNKQPQKGHYQQRSNNRSNPRNRRSSDNNSLRKDSGNYRKRQQERPQTEAAAVTATDTRQQASSDSDNRPARRPRNQSNRSPQARNRGGNRSSAKQTETQQAEAITATAMNDAAAPAAVPATKPPPVPPARAVPATEPAPVPPAGAVPATEPPPAPPAGTVPATEPAPVPVPVPTPPVTGSAPAAADTTTAAPAANTTVPANIAATPTPEPRKLSQPKAEVASTDAPEQAGPVVAPRAAGRPANDPRETARPVTAVAIETLRPDLTADLKQPVVLQAPTTIAPRAINDPRGPLPQAAIGTSEMPLEAIPAMEDDITAPVVEAER